MQHKRTKYKFLANQGIMFCQNSTKSLLLRDQKETKMP